MNPLVKLTLLAAALAVALCSSQAVGGEGRALLELRTPHETVRGRLAARTPAAAFLFTPAGRMAEVPLASVVGFRRLSSRFVPDSPRTVADALRRELGPGGAVSRTRHYIVVRHDSRVAGTFAGRLERIYAGVTGWFRRRGARVRDPEFPLVAVVLPDFPQFAEVAAAEGLATSAARVPRGLGGYYSPGTNRLTVWEPPGGATDARFADTLVHEAVHQIAFNTGLHHRTGGTPRWVAEGLATALEAPALLSPAGSTRTADRVNAGRLRAFRARSQTRPADYVTALVAGGDAVSGDVLGFYAESWAVTFYLMHARGGDYANYLAALAGGTAAAPDAPADRLRAFRAAFGDPDRVGAAADRFLADL